MAKKYARTRKRSPQLPHSDGDGNQIHNEILLSLPREERDMVFSKLEFVRLKSLQLLHEVGDATANCGLSQFFSQVKRAN